MSKWKTFALYVQMVIILLFMVGGRGLEPLTSAMSTQRSDQLS